MESDKNSPEKNIVTIIPTAHDCVLSKHFSAASHFRTSVLQHGGGRAKWERRNWHDSPKAWMGK